jgi:Protein of unknown function (DUF4199)
MKRIVLTFGLISGAIISVLMFANMSFVERIGFDRAVVVGYTTMVLAFLLVFFGIRSYRENIGNGYISFGRALSVGLLIMLISCACYVLTWEFVYSRFFPDFLDKYMAHATEQIRASGKSPQEMEIEIAEVRRMMQLYNSNIFVNMAFTFLEPLPVGLVMTFISALILRRRRRDGRDLQDYQDAVKETSVNPV